MELEGIVEDMLVNIIEQLENREQKRKKSNYLCGFFENDWIFEKTVLC